MRKSQNEMIYEHLKKHNSITTIEAFNLYGVTRLASRIWDLRHTYDVRIKAETKTAKNRYGVAVTFAEYSLKGEKKNA